MGRGGEVLFIGDTSMSRPPWLTKVSQAIEKDEKSHQLYGNRAAARIELEKFEEALKDAKVFQQ